MQGLAREAALLSGKTLKPVAAPPVAGQVRDAFPVRLAVPDACPRFAGRVIRGVNPRAATPLWLKERLRRSGLRSFNPIVDVTNYVMLELGQPLHAYDLAKLRGEIVVRQSRAGEELTLLDGAALSLQADTLLITDASGPIGLAGIMGGLSTAVSDATVDVLLESAYFTPEALAGRSRAYGLATDAGHRFERGVDWQGQAPALERATALLLELAGGKPGPLVDTVDKQALPSVQRITLRAARVQALLGMEVADKEIERILKRLGLDAQKRPASGKAGAGWQVKAPSYRFDLRLEADLIEEVSRVYGYDKLPVRLPDAALAMQPTPALRLPLNRLKDHLAARGYHEAITYSFVDADLQRRLAPAARPVPLANPLSSEMSVMRASLWCGLLKALLYNLNRQQTRVRLFETGLVFSAQREGALAFKDVRQVGKVAGLAAGARHREGWANGSGSVDFYDLKGDVESLLGHGDSPAGIEFLPGQHPALHPGQCAEVKKDGDIIGHLGMLSPQLQQHLDLPQPVYLFELALEPALALPARRSGALSRFPEVRRDLAITVDRKVNAATILAGIQTSGGEMLRHARLFDVYEGEGIAPQERSLAFGLTFQHDRRTLTDAEVDQAVDSVMAALRTGFGATRRE